MHKCNLVGVDLAKRVFQLAMADKHYHVTGSRRLNRTQFYQFYLEHAPANMVMETCGTAHCI